VVFAPLFQRNIHINFMSNEAFSEKFVATFSSYNIRFTSAVLTHPLIFTKLTGEAGKNCIMMGGTY
jgi:hypothetical protein